MRSAASALYWASILGIGHAVCPYMDGGASLKGRQVAGTPQQPDGDIGSNTVGLEGIAIDDEGSFLTSDVGGPIEDQFSLKAGIRGPSLLEDFIFRQKIQHFDHERVSDKEGVSGIKNRHKY